MEASGSIFNEDSAYGYLSSKKTFWDFASFFSIR